MAQVQHTAAQRRAIEAAWSMLCALVGNDYRCETTLRDALRHERRARSCLMSAKALLVESAHDGVLGEIGLGDAMGYAEGCRAALLIGARYAKSPSSSAQVLARFSALAPDARKAHNAAIHAALDAIKV